MATHGFLGFVANGHETITYTHSDSYPEALGLSSLKYARSITDRSEVRSAAAAIVHLDHAQVSESPNAAQLELLADRGIRVDTAPGADDSDGARRPQSWTDILLDSMGDPEAILAAGFAFHDHGWPGDSLYCEWGYVLDLDKEVFEVYQGFCTHPHSAGRFHDRPRISRGYYPVRLVAAWGLGEIPADEVFLATAQAR